MKKAAPMRVMLAMTAAMTLTAQAVAQEAVTPPEPQPVPAPQAAPAAPTPPTPASPSASAGGTFQVVRPGDSQMSCEALIAEANALNAQLSAQQNAVSERAMATTRGMIRGQQTQMGMSTAMSLGSMAAAFIPGAGLALGAAQSVAGMAQQAAAAAQRNAMMNDMDDMMGDIEANTRDLMPLMSRADHLTDLSMAKGC